MFNSKYFLIGFIFFLTIAFPFDNLINNYFKKIGEVDIDYIINIQHSSSDPILFLSGINQSSQNYKFAFLKKIEPEIVLIGSSRALQVREKFFNKKFYNLGGTATTINSLIKSIDIAKEIKSINTMIIFLDPWWFNRKYSSDGGTIKFSNFPERYNLDLILRSIKVYLNNYSSFMHDNNLGIYAKLLDSGFGRDGSYYYNNVMSSNTSFDSQFIQTQNQMVSRIDRFANYKFGDTFLIDKLCKVIKSTANNGKKIYIIGTPFPQKLHNDFRDIYNDYVKDSYELISNCVGSEQFYDATFFNINDKLNCEYIDGLHGGDVIYARILLNSMIKSPDINVKFLHNFINTRKYNSFGLINNYNQKYKESDHLNLGCKKY